MLFLFLSTSQYVDVGNGLGNPSQKEQVSSVVEFSSE